MRLELYDSLDQVLPLSPSFKLHVNGTAFEKTVKNYFARSGGYVIGDRSARPVELTLSHDVTAKSDGEFFEKQREASVFLRSGLDPYYLRVIPGSGPTIRYLVDVSKFDNRKNPGLEYRISQNEITMWALDADPEDDQPITEGPINLAPDEGLTVTNDGDGKAWPVLTVIAVDNVTEFTVENEAVRRHVTISDIGFTSGTKYVFNFLTGDVRFFEPGGTTGISRGETISDGAPFWLARGANLLIYRASSGNVSLQADFRGVYYL